MFPKICFWISIASTFHLNGMELDRHEFHRYSACIKQAHQFLLAAEKAYPANIACTLKNITAAQSALAMAQDECGYQLPSFLNKKINALSHKIAMEIPLVNPKGD